MFDSIKHAVSLLRRHRPDSTAREAVAPEPSASERLLDETSWHGDHWANLLTSPMDARHYVLEDWTSSVSTYTTEA
jgi:hypothetical protein